MSRQKLTDRLCECGRARVAWRVQVVYINAGGHRCGMWLYLCEQCMADEDASTPAAEILQRVQIAQVQGERSLLCAH